jgi:hypothetical protein
MIINNKKPLPILIITFNRPNFTQQLLEKLSSYNLDLKFYFFADKPRKNNLNDISYCTKNIDIIHSFAHSNIERLFIPENNLGCKAGITSAISWFFQSEEYGVILEDDCIPSKSFLEFCIYALDKFKDDSKVFNICGTYYGTHTSNSSYYLSTLNGIWGWATWKRAWSSIDFSMSEYQSDKFKKNTNLYFKNRKMKNWTLSYIKDEYTKRSNIWSPYLMYTKILQLSYTLTPQVNLVENIGLQSGANSTGKDFLELSEFRAKDLNIDVIINEKLNPIQNLSADLDSFSFIAMGDPRLSVKVQLHQFISTFLYRTGLIKFYHALKKLA